MSLTAAAKYSVRDQGNRVQRYVVKDTVEIFHGALVGLDPASGKVENWVDGSGNTLQFVGLASVHGDENQGESVTGDTDGTVEVEVETGGVTLNRVSVTGVTALSNVGDFVFASDENTFDVSATAGGKEIGEIVRWHSGTTVDLKVFSREQSRILEEGQP